MPPLQRTFAFAEMDHIAKAVGQHLDFDVSRLFDVFFDEHAIVAETGSRFVGGPLKSVAAFVVVVGQTHPLAAAAGTGLEHHRIADLAGDPNRVFRIVNHVGVAGHGVDARLLGELLGGDLVAHARQGVGLGTDEDDARPRPVVRRRPRSRREIHSPDGPPRRPLPGRPR